MATDERSGNEGIKSTDTMFEILSEIGDRDGAGVSELADVVGIPKSTAFDHLTSLRRNRCVAKWDREYRIGLRFLNFGPVARNRYDLYNFAKPEVDATTPRNSACSSRNSEGNSVVRQHISLDEGALVCTAVASSFFSQRTLGKPPLSLGSSPN